MRLGRLLLHLTAPTCASVTAVFFSNKNTSERFFYALGHCNDYYLCIWCLFCPCELPQMTCSLNRFSCNHIFACLWHKTIIYLYLILASFAKTHTSPCALCLQKALCLGAPPLVTMFLTILNTWFCRRLKMELGFRRKFLTSQPMEAPYVHI